MQPVGREHHLVLLAFLGVALAALAAAAIVYYRQAAAPQSGRPQTPAASVPSLDHVVIILEENKAASAVIGNTAAPYINQLAAEGAQATNYHAVTHPSLPNYLALTSGTTAGITNDCNPPGRSCQAAVPNLADALERSGRGWKMYAESMPEPCYRTNAGRYAVKHVPFLYYPSVREDAKRCAAHVVPYAQLAGDLRSETSLPDYVFISPDLCSDMHNCSVGTGDAWLAREVPRILTSPAFTKQRSLLVLTWDEGSRLTNHVPLIFAGPAAKRQFTSDVRYTHYSLLRTIEAAWGLSPLTGNDAAAPVMNDLLK